jgi:hypothetical protein
VRGISGIFFLNSCPPKLSNNGSDFRDKSFRKENRGHIINRDGA